MGSKTSTQIYGEESSKNVECITTGSSTIIQLFINHFAYPTAGLIVVTQKWVLSYNWHTGSPSFTFDSENEILLADWNLESDQGAVIMIGTTDRVVRLLSADDLTVQLEINTNEWFADESPKITTLSWGLERDLVIGFSNGAVISYNWKELKQNHVLIGPGFFSHLESSLAVQFIKVNPLDRMILISFINYFDKIKSNKAPNSLIIIFNWDTGEYVRQAVLPRFTIINMSVVEERNLIIMTIEEENSLFVMDYTSCKGIAKLGETSNSQILVWPISKATYEAQMNLYDQALDADALCFSPYSSNSILSGLIKSTKKINELHWTWTPQHLYSTKFIKSGEDEAIGSINCIWYNLILDILVVSDESGSVFLIQNIFYHTLRNNLKTTIKTDIKQPLFSIGLSSSSKQGNFEWLTTEKHAVKLEEENDESKTSNSKPLLSLGIYKNLKQDKD